MVRYCDGAAYPAGAAGRGDGAVSEHSRVSPDVWHYHGAPGEISRFHHYASRSRQSRGGNGKPGRRQQPIDYFEPGDQRGGRPNGYSLPAQRRYKDLAHISDEVHS